MNISVRVASRSSGLLLIIAILSCLVIAGVAIKKSGKVVGSHLKSLNAAKKKRLEVNMNKDIIEKLFPDALRRIEAGRCPICAEVIKPEEFRTELDVKEHKISGLCQACITKTFK